MFYQHSVLKSVMKFIYISKNFFLCAALKFNMKYLDLIPCFQKLAALAQFLTSDKCFTAVEEMSLQHKYMSLKFLFVHRKAQRKFLSL